MGGTSAGLHEPQDQFHPQPEHGQWKQPDGKLCALALEICESHLRTMAFCPGLWANTARSAHGSIESESNQFLLAERISNHLFLFQIPKSSPGSAFHVAILMANSGNMRFAHQQKVGYLFGYLVDVVRIPKESDLS